MKKTAKLLSILLCLSLVIGMIGVIASAEEAAPTYTKVTSLEDVTDGQYVVAVNQEDKYYAMDTNFDGSKVATLDITESVSGSTITGADLPVWTLTIAGSNENGSKSITFNSVITNTKDSTVADRYLVHPNSGSANFSIVETPEVYWNMVENASVEGTFHITGNVRMLMARPDKGYFGAYAASNVGTYCDALELYKLDEAEEEVETVEAYVKVTSGELTSGQYILVNDKGYAPTVLSGSWVLAGTPTVSDDIVTDTKGAVWTLTVDGNTVTLTDSNGTSIAPSGGNNNGIKSGNYSWGYTFADGKFTFEGQGSDTVKLALNNTEGKYRAYKNTTISGNPSSYPSAFTLYQLTEIAVTPPEETDPTVPSEPTEPETPVVLPTATLTSTLTDGDEVVIYYPIGNLVMSGTASGSRLAGADTVVADNKLDVTEDMAVLTVSVDENGYYTFTCDGKYLTSGATGNSLTLADAASDLSLWELEATDGGYFIKSVNAAYNGNAQYMEYYSGFTTYGKSATANVAIYTFQFFALEDESDVTPPVDPQPPVDPEPSDPEPSDPEPSDPEPSDPEPSDPEPSDPEPSDPEPSDPEPSDPEPSDPEPSDPEPSDPPKTEFTGTLITELKDGDKVVIFSVANNSLMTGVEYVYEGSSYTKVELEQLEVTLAGNTVTYGAGAVVLTVHIDGDTISFTDPNGKYLYADGTDVKFVSEAGDYTKFVLEETEGGYFVKCATATYNDKPQYLEVYGGYFTCYGMGTNTSIYTFQFYAADADTPTDIPSDIPDTGDYTISVFVALMAVSAAGIAVVASKKKEF